MSPKNARQHQARLASDKAAEKRLALAVRALIDTGPMDMLIAAYVEKIRRAEDANQARARFHVARCRKKRAAGAS